MRIGIVSLLFSCVALAACSNDASEPPAFKDGKGRVCSRASGDYKPSCDVAPTAACFNGNTPCYQLDPSGMVDVDGKTIPGALAVCARCCAANGDWAGGVSRDDCAPVVCTADADCADEPGARCKAGICRK